jgi:hypothetical protein
MGRRPAGTFSTVHPAAAIFHFVVFAGLTSGSAVRATECLHGVSFHFGSPLPGAS